MADQTALYHWTAILGATFVVPAVSVVYRGGAIPVAWVILPGGHHAGARPRGFVQSYDLLPTVLDILGVEQLSFVIGRSALAVLDGGTQLRDHVVTAYTDHCSFRTNRWNLPTPCEDRHPTGPLRLFDLEFDPAETTNVSPFTAAQGVEGLQRLFASVAAGDPPEVAWIDRFQLANLAVRKTVASIDAYVKRDKYDLKRYFNPLLEEVTGIDGKTYGLPSSTDNRAIWWNKRLLREAGGDAERGPQTWDDLRQFGVRATRTGGDGGITQLGWNHKSPGFGILYLWSWIAGAEFFSKDGRTAQYNHPGVIAALDFLLAGADAQGGTAKVDAFLATASQAGDPFITDRVIIHQPAAPLPTIARQRPDMEFGWATFPIRRAGDKIQTFAGGFSWAVPFGTKNPDVSWAALRSLMSEEALAAWAASAAGVARAGGGVFIPGFTTVQDVDRKLRQQYATGIKTVDAAWDFTIDLMRHARVRPVSPAAADAWDALSETWTNVLARKQTPKEACDAMNVKVQRSLDEAYGKK